MKMLVIPTLLLVAITAQAAEIVVEPVHYASRPSGKVVDPTGASISDVSVELVPCGVGDFEGHLLGKDLEVARTDAKGRFVVTHAWHHDSRTCLSFSRDGFNYHQFELKYKPNAGPLVVKLSIAA
jgi:hypothetical protein